MISKVSARTDSAHERRQRFRGMLKHTPAIKVQESRSEYQAINSALCHTWLRVKLKYSRGQTCWLTAHKAELRILPFGKSE